MTSKYVQVKIDNNSPLTEMEAWELTQVYAKYYYKNTMYQIKRHYTAEDIASEYYCKFLERGFLQKYNPEKCSKKYYIMMGVRNFVVDLQRVYMSKGAVHSLNKTIEGAKTEYHELLSDNTDFTVTSNSKIEVEKFLDKLPDVQLCSLCGYSPLLGEYILTAKTITQHLLNGYTGKDIASHFLNPKTGKTLSVGRVNSLIVKIKRYVKNENLLATI